jgi:hypothetical protein
LNTATNRPFNPSSIDENCRGSHYEFASEIAISSDLRACLTQVKIPRQIKKTICRGSMASVQIEFVQAAIGLIANENLIGLQVNFIKVTA